MGNLGEELEMLDNSSNIEPIIANIRELLGAIFIQEQRNYDMLSIIADKLGADAKGLYKMHTEGSVLAPAPSFIFEEESDKSDLQDSLFEIEKE